MAYDIGPKIGIEGEAEFRNAIKQINTNLKTLGTEMLAVTSYFDKNDKSMEALTAQNKVLNKQIDEQKGKLTELQKGLQASAEKYGETDKVTQGWQQAVNKATADLNKMERELKDNTQAIEKGSSAADEMADNVEEFGKSADDAGKKTITFGDIIKANLISEAIIGGVKALGNAMIDIAKAGIELTKESLANAASIGEIEAAYEQVMGDSADYANNKLKELSNNTGAITSRLKEDFTTQTASWTGLGKTVEEATDLANRSITVAADYAAMYGKSTEESSERIKSFMNGNLGAAESLGISASAAGIASWASKELGIEYDKLEESEKKIIRLNFVETMAENAGITGQAARESSNYANVMENLDKTISDLKSRLGTSLLPTVLDVAQGFTGMFDGTLSVQEGITKITDSVMGLAGNLVNSIPAIAEAGKEITTQLIQGVFNNLPQLAKAGKDILESLGGAISSNIALVLDTAKTIIEGLIQGITETLPTIIPTAISILIGIADTIINNIGNVVDVGINILTSLIQGIISSLPTLIQEVPRIINEFSNSIYAQLPKLLKAGIDILLMLIKGIIDSIPTLIANIPQIILAIVNVITLYNWANLGKSLITNIGEGIKGMTGNIGSTAKSLSESVGTMITNVFKGGFNWGKGLITNIGSGFNSMLTYITTSISSLGTSVLNAIKGVFTGGFDIGKYLIEGLWNGILGAKDWVLSKVGDFAGSIIGAFAEKWGIASPSKVMDEYGHYLDEGLAEGIEGNADKPLNAMNKVASGINLTIQTITDAANAAVEAVKSLASAETMSKIAKADSQSSAARSASQSKYEQEKKNFEDAYTREINAYSKMYDVDKSVAAEILKKDLEKSIPKYATGTNDHPGGLAWVGELGRELVELPRGSKVYTNYQSENMAKTSGRPINLNLNIGTLIADDYGLKQLERKLRNIRIDENFRLGVPV